MSLPLLFCNDKFNKAMQMYIRNGNVQLRYLQDENLSLYMYNLVLSEMFW